MKTQNNHLYTPVHIELKLWQYELEMFAKENDFLLNLLVSLQDDQLICTRNVEKTVIFFNHFQYFTHFIKHFKKNLIVIDKVVLIGIEDKNISNGRLSNFKEEMNSMGKSFKPLKSILKILLYK